MTIRRNIKWGLLVALALGCFTSTAIAGKQNLAQIYMFTAKSGHEAELYEAIKEHAEWRKAEGDPWVWTVYQTTTGSDTGKYIIRSGSHSWSCFDAYADFLAKGSVEWNKNVAQHIATSQSIIMGDHETLHDWPTEPGQTNLLNITWYDLKSGKMQDFFDLVTTYHEAIQEHDYDTHYSFSRVVSGDSGNRVVLALPFASYTDMEEPEENLWMFLKRILGEEKMKELGEEWADCVEASEGYIIQFHPELSVLPDAG